MLDPRLARRSLLALFLVACPKAQDTAAPSPRKQRSPPPTKREPKPSEKGNLKIKSFSKAKRLLGEIHTGHRTTLYCGCRFNEDRKIDHKSCGYRVKKDKKRAARVEWEHVVPAHAFGQRFEAWRKGHPRCQRKGRPFKGRSCAERASPEFRQMQADMYNLFPSVGEVNGQRSNYRMAEIPGEKREFGDCDFEVEDRKVEPRPSARGKIARAYLYMNAVYPGFGIVTKKSRRLFEAWAKKHPPTAWECERGRKIKAVQGNANPILEQACAQR